MCNHFFDILEKKFKMNLNSQQKEAVLHKDGPAVVLAVPGAGKTTVLISRTANLIINHNINPQNILSLTFSKASANDMKERFDTVFGQAIGSSNVHFSTIHSFAYMLIRDYSYINRISYNLIEGYKNGISKNIIIKQIYEKTNGSVINDDKLEELINTIGYVKNMMIDVEEFQLHRNFDIKNFNIIYNEYEKYKKTNNYIDFDDMLTLSLEIFQNKPQLLKKYRNRYTYVQVDEGQDTSKIQNEIIRLLTSPKNNLFVVADDDQSIYGFRGAFPDALLKFDKIYSGTKKFFMEHNYRSSQNIVSVCNEFIKSNKKRYEKNLVTKNTSNRPVTIVKLRDEFRQLEYLVDKLKSKENLSDTAILYRNNISSISIIEALSRNGVPFFIRDSKLHFFDHWVVRDVIAFMMLALNDKDIKSFERIYFKMNGYISKLALKYIISNHTSEPIFERLLNFPDFKPFQKDNILRLRSGFKYLSKRKPSTAIRFILYELEYDIYLKKNCKKFGYSYENIKMLLSNLRIIASNCNTIEEFINRLMDLQKLIENAKYNENNAIRLSTIHSSKGLEFGSVFMIDLIDGDFPSSSSIDLSENGEVKALEEERRLFYVGMTRSKTHLDLLTIKSRNEERIYQSRFINELEAIVNKAEGNEYVSSHEFKVGSKVHHRKFGVGRIKAIDDDIITIHFNSKGEKKISLTISVENNLLRAI